MPLPSSKGAGGKETSASIPRAPPQRQRGISPIRGFGMSMPLSSSRNIGGGAEACASTTSIPRAASPMRATPHWANSPMRKLGKLGGKSSATSAVECLKLQHAEELATANEEHARQLGELESEVVRCRAEIDALRALSDEHCDTLMPLPSPSKSLKFVKNTTGRRARKLAANASNGGKSVAIMVADIKQQHKKDLAKAAEIYARKLHALKKDVQKYKKEAEAYRTSAIGDDRRDCNDAGVNIKTGVAQNDKENVSDQRAMNESSLSSRLKKNEGDAIEHEEINPISRKSSARSEKMNGGNQNEKSGANTVGGSKKELDDVTDPYERLFLEDYQFERVPDYEEVLKKCAVQKAAKSGKIRAICQDLIAFMEDVVKEKSVGSSKERAE